MENDRSEKVEPVVRLANVALPGPSNPSSQMALIAWFVPVAFLTVTNVENVAVTEVPLQRSLITCHAKLEVRSCMILRPGFSNEVAMKIERHESLHFG